MSGIFGVYCPDRRPVEHPSLEKMAACLAHRGTDGMGLWCEGPVGLGHRMRWTTTESLHETLPFSRPNEKLAITADARLDNRDELSASLNLSDRAVSDSTLILLAYDRWGDTCTERLLGDFAFVIWDGRRQALFYARDPMGVKPLYGALRRVYERYLVRPNVSDAMMVWKAATLGLWLDRTGL